MIINLKAISQKTVIIIAGPTAAGKTRVAIEIARHFHTEIISADSRQCYRELRIGVARPSTEELAAVRHHFIASHSITENITAAWYEQYAMNTVADLFKRYDTIVMVGGTGLYIKAFSAGLDKIPEIDPLVRERIIVNYNERGIEWLQQELNVKDPEFSVKGEMKNPQRMMRALEVIDGTGHSIYFYQKETRPQRSFNIVRIGIDIPKDQLEGNINTRVDNMISTGLVEEVRLLYASRSLNALQTVGYSEIFEFLDGRLGLNEAINRIKINTRQYAKRQLTWFRKDKSFTWFRPDSQEILRFLNAQKW